MDIAMLSTRNLVRISNSTGMILKFKKITFISTYIFEERLGILTFLLQPNLPFSFSIPPAPFSLLQSPATGRPQASKVAPKALPNQQTVDYPSFKLVIVGDGGTGMYFWPNKYLFISIYVN
ncbi:hypothetical protein OIU78_011579 [Salix suchowensis]|nr:hypothetical protein OIU78_011579 [Salix suchowensis]